MCIEPEYYADIKDGVYDYNLFSNIFNTYDSHDTHYYIRYNYVWVDASDCFAKQTGKGVKVEEGSMDAKKFKFTSFDHFNKKYEKKCVNYVAI